MAIFKYVAKAEGEFLPKNRQPENTDLLQAEEVSLYWNVSFEQPIRIKNLIKQKERGALAVTQVRFEEVGLLCFHKFF